MPVGKFQFYVQMYLVYSNSNIRFGNMLKKHSELYNYKINIKYKKTLLYNTKKFGLIEK